jgi:hypothetical protein
MSHYQQRNLERFFSKYKPTGILYTLSHQLFLFPSLHYFVAKSSLFDCGKMKDLQMPNYEEGLEKAEWCNTFHTFLHPFLREHSR